MTVPHSTWGGEGMLVGGLGMDGMADERKQLR